MAGPPTPEERMAGEEGFFEHLRSLVASVVGYLGARFQLAGIESKEAFGHYFRIVLWLAAAAAVAGFGYIFLWAAGIFLIAHLLHLRWVWVMLACGGVHVVLALWCLWVVRRKLVVPMFSSTINEFKKDQEWLTTPKPN
jgi:uncharacterized membrane protein YqjE